MASAGLFSDGGQDTGFVGPDYDAAEHWCRRAVASGSAEAKALLGFILIAGPEAPPRPGGGRNLVP